MNKNEKLNNGYILSKEIVELLEENRLGSIFFKPFISVYEFIERILELSSFSIEYLNKKDSKKINQLFILMKDLS